MAQDTRFKNFTEFERALFERQRKIKDVLPPGLKVDRFLALAKLMVSEDMDLLHCTNTSLIRAIYKAARDGLELGVDAIVARYEQEARYMPFYSGMVTMLTRTGLVGKVFTEAVYAADIFELDHGSAIKPIRHVPARTERGALQGAYAAVVYKTGFWQVHYMDGADIERAVGEQRLAKAKMTDPWVKHQAEMWRKTALHNLSKYCPVAPQLSGMLADPEEVLTAAQHIDEMFDRHDGRPEPLDRSPGQAVARPEPVVPVTTGVEAATASEDAPDVFPDEEEGF
jgi:recombination protein RecT